MDDTIGILHDIKRLQNDGFLIFILQYNFKALVDETMAVTQAVPTHIVDQFLKQFPIYEKGKGHLSQVVTTCHKLSYNLSQVIVSRHKWSKVVKIRQKL